MTTTKLMLSLCTLISPLLLQYQVYASTSPSCVALKLQETTSLKSFWFVPKNNNKVYLSDSLDAAPSHHYVISGDLLVSTKENGENICASYIHKGKVTAFGWIKKGELTQFNLVDFGSASDNVQEVQNKLKQAHQKLSDLASKLPAAEWQGEWVDGNKNSVTFKKKAQNWTLNTMGIHGTVGTGNDEEDSQEINIKGAFASLPTNSKETTTFDPCDIVVVGFNNAIVATSGNQCMGSGDQSSWPSFNGFYWKK